MNNPLLRKWQQLISVWVLDPALVDQTFEDVCRHYGAPGRYYHNLDHILDVLATVTSLQTRTSNPAAVELAAWLHDVIYDSKAADNEERSAAYAEHLCQQLAIPIGPLVASLILKTKTHDAGADDSDAQVLLDADLAILGAEKSVYRAYCKQIRQEYAWVPDPDFRAGRRRILESFLNRPRIYCHLHTLEVPARQNMAAEMARLAALPEPT